MRVFGVLVPFVDPLRVSVWFVLFVVVCVKGSLLTMSKPKIESLGGLGTMEKPWLPIELVKFHSVVSWSHLSHVLYSLLLVGFCCLYVVCHACTCYGLFVWWCWYPTCTFTYDSLVHKPTRMLMKPFLMLHEGIVHHNFSYGTLACWWSPWYIKQTLLNDDEALVLHMM